jgi:hypothetical protein
MRYLTLGLLLALVLSLTPPVADLQELALPTPRMGPLLELNGIAAEAAQPKALKPSAKMGPMLEPNG